MNKIEEYTQSYKDGIFIVTKGNKVLVSQYEPELAMLEDILNEACEEGILPTGITLSI